MHFRWCVHIRRRSFHVGDVALSQDQQLSLWHWQTLWGRLRSGRGCTLVALHFLLEGFGYQAKQEFELRVQVWGVGTGLCVYLLHPQLSPYHRTRHGCSIGISIAWRCDRPSQGQTARVSEWEVWDELICWGWGCEFVLQGQQSGFLRFPVVLYGHVLLQQGHRVVLAQLGLLLLWLYVDLLDVLVQLDQLLPWQLVGLLDVPVRFGQLLPWRLVGLPKSVGSWMPYTGQNLGLLQVGLVAEEGFVVVGHWLRHSVEYLHYRTCCLSLIDLFLWGLGWEYCRCWHWWSLGHWSQRSLRMLMWKVETLWGQVLM